MAKDDKAWLVGERAAAGEHNAVCEVHEVQGPRSK